MGVEAFLLVGDVVIVIPMECRLKVEEDVLLEVGVEVCCPYSNGEAESLRIVVDGEEFRLRIIPSEVGNSSRWLSCLGCDQ